jgi:hypothetical protein
MAMRHKDGTRHEPVSRLPCPHPECWKGGQFVTVATVEATARWADGRMKGPVPLATEVYRLRAHMVGAVKHWAWEGPLPR